MTINIGLISPQPNYKKNQSFGAAPTRQAIDAATFLAKNGRTTENLSKVFKTLTIAKKNNPFDESVIKLIRKYTLELNNKTEKTASVIKNWH